MIGKKSLYFISLLIAICLISSILLSLEKTPEICLNPEGCQIVQSSHYAFTFGIKNSALGIGVFSILLLVLISQINFPNKIKEKIIGLSLILGFLVSLYFLYLQKFIIKAYCTYCLIVDFSILIAFLIFTISWKKF